MKSLKIYKDLTSQKFETMFDLASNEAQERSLRKTYRGEIPYK